MRASWRIRLERADESMVYSKKSERWEPGNPDSDKVKERVDYSFEGVNCSCCANNKERKDTGGYYTPDIVTKYIVAETLAPL